SWMILPYDSTLIGWKSIGTAAGEITRGIASDDARLEVRIAEGKKIWNAWVAPGAELNVGVIDTCLLYTSDAADEVDIRACHA
ncbi:hypothetical protein Q2389_26580, partial [Escherichia coli]|nr:hypothetical protein [Escherichia coli]